MLRIAILCSALLALAAMGAPAQPCIPSSGPTTIVQPTVVGATWVPSGSPYRIQGNLTVQSLTIQPGVRIEVAPGRRITVTGILTAIGTPSCPIVFTSQTPTTGSPTLSQRWDTLELIGASPKTLRYCRIEHAANSGIRVSNSAPTLEYCLMRNNVASIASGSGQGGGVWIEANATGLVVTLTDCTVEQNSADRFGGGIFAQMSNGSEVHLVRCRVQGNVAIASGPTMLGGGVYASGNAMLEDCLVLGNRVQTVGYGTLSLGGGLAFDGGGSGQFSALRCTFASNVCQQTVWSSHSRGGGVWVANAVGSLTNCTLTCNVVQGGNLNVSGGAHFALSSCTVVNCTIANNISSGIEDEGGTTALTNSIVWGNNAGGAQLTGTGTITATYSNVQVAGGGVFGGNTNMNMDPLFVTASGVAGQACSPFAFAIGPFSPCLDAGDPSAAFQDGCIPTAFPGAPPSGPRNDMGALGGPLNCGFAAPARLLGGANPYGQAVGGLNNLSIDWVPSAGGAPGSGQLTVTGAAPLGIGFVAVSAAPAFVPLASGQTLLVDLSGTAMLLPVVPIAFDPTGTWNPSLSLSMPTNLGAAVYVQAADVTSGLPTTFSNGVEIIFGY